MRLPDSQYCSSDVHWQVRRLRSPTHTPVRCWFHSSSGPVLATGTGNLPAVPVRTAKMGDFGSTPVQKPDPLLLGGPHPAPYLSTCGFRWFWLDRLVPNSGSVFQGSLYIFAFRYANVHCKIWTLVRCCPFLMHLPP